MNQLETHPAVHPLSRKFLEAGYQLTGLIELWQGAPWRVEPSVVDQGIQMLNRYLLLTQDIEELQYPKRHLAMHCVKLVGVLGNPRYYANWLDESLNKVLRSTCRNVSQATFDMTVLSGMRRLSGFQCSPEDILKAFLRG